MISRKELMLKYWFFHPETDLRNSLMAFGFECDDGWLDLIDNLCAEIEAFYDENHPDDKSEFEVVQVKEKFGQLRFYMSGSYTEVFDIVDKYTELSGMTCEICGKPGKLGETNHWYKTLCPGCAGDLKKAYAKRMERILSLKRGKC